MRKDQKLVVIEVLDGRVTVSYASEDVEVIMLDWDTAVLESVCACCLKPLEGEDICESCETRLRKLGILP
jgi:hypothetical protein